MRKDGQEETDGKTVLVAGKVSNQTYRDVETFRESRGLSRSQVVADALSHYISSNECVNCGELNNGKGKICSCCGARLFDDDTIKEVLKKLGMSNTYADDEDHLPRHILEMSADTYTACRESGLDYDLTPIIDRKVSPSQYACEIQFILKDTKTRLKLVSDAHISIPKEVLYAGLIDNKFGDGNLFKRICSGEAGETELKNLLYDGADIEDFDSNAVLDFLLK